MRALTMVLPHFCNVGMLAEQQKVWADYPDDLRARMHVVVVDDCSPKGFRPTRKAVTVEGLASFRIYRLMAKKRWNWLACRNLGAKVAGTSWLLMTDIDHVVPTETMARIMAGPLDAANSYRFRRVDAPRTWPYTLAECASYKMHNDSWLLTRDLFFDPRVGGYDERLSGCYGTSGEFRDRVVSASRAHVVLPEVLIRYPREIIPDASTPPTVYTRKGDPKNDALLSDLKAQRDLIPNWQPLHGLIQHELIYESEAVAA